MTAEENKKVALRFNKEFLERVDTEELKQIVADDLHIIPRPEISQMM